MLSVFCIFHIKQEMYQCLSQLYTEGKPRKVNSIFENFTGHKIEFSVQAHECIK